VALFRKPLKPQRLGLGNLVIPLCSGAELLFLQLVVNIFWRCNLKKLSVEKVKSLAGKIYWNKANKDKTAKQCIYISLRQLGGSINKEDFYPIELYIAHGVE
tara:strand:- start:2257 stop:2562 length:306 start_codon:yes stop_codon:yes gene_type:complete